MTIGGYLGRRYRHCGHRAHGTQHATRVALHCHRFQQLSYVTVSIAEGAPQRRNGRLAASTAPGLGTKPRMEVQREPVVRIGKT